jgi:hypothetical protein
MDRYVIDVVRDDLLIEIQTSGFASLGKKLRRLLGLGHQVRVVHPVPLTKTIVRLGSDGEILGRRKSPKHGTRLDVFSELVYIKDLLDDPRLAVQVVLTIEDEYRKHDPDRAWRRRGWVVQERRLTSVEESIDLSTPDDFAALLPGGLPARFTTADLVDLTGCTRRVAQQTTYCLRHLGGIEVCGKAGRSVEYRSVLRLT